MEYAALSAPAVESALKRLDHLIAEVHFAGDQQLLLEHLQSARVYLLGSMPDEYEFSLVAAKDSSGKLPDTAFQQAVTHELVHLLEQLKLEQARDVPPRSSSSPSRPPIGSTGKSILYGFFHGAATSMGVFYPTHYIFASFPSFQNAMDAAKALQSAGYPECVAASAAETTQFMEELRSDAGLWGAMMASVSRFFGTEEVFADIDIAEAEKGAGFLAVHCPREDQADRIRDLVSPFKPLAMQLYLAGGIRSLVAGRFPGPEGHHPESIPS